MNERTKEQNGGCPAWCLGEHDADAHPEDRWHRSRTRSVPVVGWLRPGGEEAEAAVVHVALVAPAEGEDTAARLRIEADGWPAIDLDPCSARRVGAALAATLVAESG